MGRSWIAPIHAIGRVFVMWSPPFRMAATFSSASVLPIGTTVVTRVKLPRAKSIPSVRCFFSRSASGFLFGLVLTVFRDGAAKGAYHSSRMAAMARSTASRDP